MTPDERDIFNQRFESVSDASDFWSMVRLRGFGSDECTMAMCERFYQSWNKSKRKGKHGAIVDRKRRKAFGPGRFHAASPSGVFLNRNFVKGWRGVNPRHP